MTTIVPTEYQKIVNTSQKEEEDFKKQLLVAQKNKEQKYTQQQKDDLKKYAPFLTFKSHGEGAFGQVTEYFDLVERRKLARKQFRDLKDMKGEYEIDQRILKEFSKQELSTLLAGIVDIDVEKLSIFYEEGLFTLEEFIEKRRNVSLLWFEREEQLGYLIQTIFNLIMSLFKKNVYHGDLKPQNIIVYKDEFGQFQLKLIDIGGVTFDHSYLIAITPQYFPNMQDFPATTSKENRIKAELFQFGRIIQEICLSSIHSHLQPYYTLEEKFISYREFKSHYFENSKEKIQESLDLISQFYSENIAKLLKGLLELSSTPENIKKQIEPLQKLDHFKDDYNFSVIIESEKQDKFFKSAFNKDNNGGNSTLEMEFYYQFELEEQGHKVLESKFTNKYNTPIKDGNNLLKKEKFDYEDTLLIIYLFLYGQKNLNFKQFDNTIKSFFSYDVTWSIKDPDTEDERKEEYLKIAEKILFHKDVTQEMRYLLFQELCATPNDQGSILGFTEKEDTHKKQYFEQIHKLFKISEQKEFGIETILVQIQMLFQGKQYLLFEHQSKLVELLKKTEDLASKQTNVMIQKMLYDLVLKSLIQVYKQQATFVQQFNTPEQAKGFLLQIQPQIGQYYPTEFKEQYEKLLEGDIKKFYIEKQTIILNYIEGIVEKYPFSNKLKQSALIQMSAQYISTESISFDQKTRIQTVKNEGMIQKAHEITLKAKNLSDKYGSTSEDLSMIYQRILLTSNLLKKEKEYEMHYRASEILQLRIPPRQKQDMTDEEHYKLCQNYEKNTRNIMKETDYETLKRSEMVVHDSAFYHVKPAKFIRQYDYKTQSIVGKPERYVFVQASYLNSIITELEWQFDSYKNSMKRNYCENMNDRQKKRYQEDLRDIFEKYMDKLLDGENHITNNGMLQESSYSVIKPGGECEEITKEEGIKRCVSFIEYQFILSLVKSHVLNKENFQLPYEHLDFNSVLKVVNQIKEKYNKDENSQKDINVQLVLYSLLHYKQNSELEDKQLQELNALMKDTNYNKQQSYIIKILQNYYKNVQEKQEQVALQKQKEEEEEKLKKEKEEQEKKQKEKEQERKQKEKEEQERKQKEKEQQEKLQKEKEEQEKLQKEKEEYQRKQKEQEEQEEKKKKQQQIQQQKQTENTNTTGSKKAQEQKAKENKREETACCLIF